MSSVDNRVVKMTFDNAQFEKKIKSTMEILSQFEKSLKMDGATAGFDEISKAADKLDLSVISDKASKEADKIDKASEEASKSIDKIDDSADKADFSSLSKSASKAVDEVNTAAESVNFTPMSEAADDAASSINTSMANVDTQQVSREAKEAGRAFGVLETVAAGALFGIGTFIEQYGIQKLMEMKNAIMGPMVDGFKEYETQIGAIQTIIANTGMSFDSDEDIARVNAALDELNTYADETIYNFTEMTRAIGTFTSSGLGLDEAKNAVKGAANVAALAGADAAKLNQVLPQLAQALSAGVVSQQDWMSVQNAQMDSRLFREAIGDVAIHMAEAGKAEETAFIAGQALLEGANMRQLLNKVDSKDIAGWFSSDILAESLQMFTYDFDKMTAEEIAQVKEHLAELGYTTDEEIQKIYERAQMARRAAQEVRTWDQLKQTISEAIGSNWAGIWRNFIGDFKQATDTFTFLSQTLSAGVDGLLGGLVHAMQVFNRFEDTEGIFGEEGGIYRVINELWGTYARDAEGQKIIENGDFVRIKGALDYIVEAITKPLGAIKDAFDSVFGMDDATLFQNMLSFVLAFKDFAASLVISDDAATGIRQTFEGLFSIVDIGIHIILDAIAIIGKIIQGIRVFLDPLVDIVLTIFGQIGKVIFWIHDKILEVREAIIYTMYQIGDSFGNVGGLVSNIIGSLNIPTVIQKIGDGLINLLELIWDFIDIPALIGGIGDAFGGLLGAIVNGLAELLGWNQAWEDAQQLANETGEYVSVIDVWIQNLLNNPIIAFIKGIFDAIAGGIAVLTQAKDETEETSEKFGVLSTVLGVMEQTIGIVFSVFKILVDTITSILAPILPVVLEILKVIAVVLGGAVINGISLVVNLLITLGGILASIIQVVGTGFIAVFGGFAIRLVALAKAIGGLIVRLVKFFLAWEPIANVINMVKKFKDKVVDYIISIPGKISKAFGDVSKSVSGFSFDIQSVFNKMDELIKYFSTVTPEQFIQDVKNFFGGIKDTIVGYAMVIPNKLRELYEVLLNIKFEDIANAMLEGLNNAYKSVRYAFKTITDVLHDVLVGFFGMDESDFSVIVDTIREKLVYPINNVIGDLWNIVRNARDNSESIPEFFGNLFSSLGTYIWNGLTDIYNTVADKIKEIFNYISSIDYNDVVLFIEGLIYIADQALSNLFGNIELILYNLIGHFFGYDNAALIVGILNNYIVLPIVNTLYEIFYWIDWARRNSTDLPSFLANLAGVMLGLLIRWGKNILNFIGNVLKSIGLIFVGGIALIGKGIVDSIKMFVGGEGTEEIKKSWQIIGTTINNAIRGVLNKISPKLREVYDKIIEFFFGSEEKASKFGEIFNGIKDTVKNAFDNISNVIGSLKDKIVDNFDKILTKLSEIDGPIGDAFTFIKDKIDELKSKFDNLKLPTSFGEFVDKIRELFTGLKDALKLLVFGNGEDDKLSIFERLKEIFGDKAGDIWSKLKDVPGAIAGFFNSIVSNISMETVQKVIDIVELILKARLVDSLRELMSGIGKLSKAIAKKIRREEQESIQDILRSIAITFAIIGAVIWVLSTIEDPWPAVGVLAVVGLMILGMQAVSTLLSKWQGDYKSGEDLLKAALSIAAVAGGILLMLHAIEKLTEFDFEANKKGLFALGGFLVVFLGVYATFAIIQRDIGDGGKNAIQVALGIAILGIALRLLMDPIKQISEFFNGLDAGEILKTCVGLAAVVGVIVGLAFALSLVPNKGAIGGALAMVIMAAAVSILVDALVLLTPVAMLNPIGMLDIILGIALLMGAFAAIAQVCKAGDLILTSIALVLFNAGLAIMIEALAKLASVPAVNMQILLDILLGIGLLIAEYAAIAQICNAGDLMLTSVAIILFSAAIYVIASALAELAEVDPETLKASAIAIGGIMAVFGVLAAVLSIPVISQAAMIIIPLLAIAFVALGAACLMIAKALQMTVQGLAGLGMVTPILLIFVNAVASNALAFGIAAIALAAIGAAFLVFGPGAMLAGAGLMLLSTGIREFLILIIQLPVLLQAASMSIQTLLGMLPDFIANLWTTVSTWFTQTFLPGLGGFFENIFSKLGELKDKFMTWWNETAWPMISETASRFWNWVQTEGIPKLGEFILWIFGKLGELKDKFFAWLGTDGLPMLQNAAGSFWNWVVTEGIPKLGEFIGKVMGKLGELISKVWNWVRTEGLPAAANWVKEMVQKAKDTFGPKIENFIKGIPKKIKEAIEGIWEDLKDKGKQIANGLADGISGDDSKSVVSNAVTALSGWIPQGVKDFFGIQSPSKLMKYEIGRYIPEGLAAGIREFAPVAGLAAKKLAEETLSGVNDGFNGAEYATPKLTPVIDINDFSSGINSYNKMLEDSIFGGNATYSGALSGELALSSQLASMIDADMSRTDSLNSTMHDIQQSLQENSDKTEELYMYTASILDALNGNTSAIRDSVADGMKIYMDSGAMVGALAPEMDRALGRRAALAERGVY